MSLSSLHLDAFCAAAKLLNFSRAAKQLCITQSALSQRVKSLEEELNVAVFVRTPRGVQLTEAGARLLQYCQVRQALEQDLLNNLMGGEDGLAGVLRIAGYSSVIRSVVLPALAPLLRDHPRIQPVIHNVEMRELPEYLLSGQVDMIVIDRPLHREDVLSVPIGYEEYVLIEGRQVSGHTDVYLDHDPQDSITARFLSMQATPPPEYRRAYMDEVYAIIDGVALGVGRAVMSRHLIANDSRIRIVTGMQPMTVPVLLYYRKQANYSALHEAVIGALSTECPILLGDIDTSVAA